MHMSNSYLWILFVIMVLSAVVLAYAIICNNDCKKRKRSKCCVYTGANYPNHPVSSADDVEYGPNELFILLQGSNSTGDSTGFIAAQQSFSVSDNMDRIYATFSCVNSLYFYSETTDNSQTNNATGSIELDLLVDGVPLPTGGHIVLNSLQSYDSTITEAYTEETKKSANSHTFVLQNLTPGSHLIQVQATLFVALNSDNTANYSEASVTLNERTLVLMSGANQSQCSVKHDRCGCYKKKCCSSPSSSSSCPSSSSSSSCSSSSSSSSSHCPSSSSHCS